MDKEVSGGKLPSGGVRYLSLELDLTISSPMSIGSYEPNVTDELWYLRPTSVKGVWRWWARALIAGVLYDRGSLEEKKVVKYVSDVMGLGSTSESSSYKISVTVRRRPESSKTVHDLQRYKLLSLARGRPRFVEGGRLSLRVDIMRRKEGNEAALWSLLLALTLSGIGKGARRGLGCVDVIALRSSGLKINLIRGQDANSIAELVKRAYESSRRLVLREASREPTGIPQLPALSKNASRIGVIEGMTLSKLHNFFLRSKRTEVLLGNYRAQDVLRRRREAWILGLPREQRRTGYLIREREKVSRRASPIILSFHKQFATITTLLSSDWPQELIWRGRGGEVIIDINEQRIREAFHDAINEFEEYVKALGGKVRWVWP